MDQSVRGLESESVQPTRVVRGHLIRSAMLTLAKIKTRIRALGFRKFVLLAAGSMVGIAIPWSLLVGLIGVDGQVDMDIIQSPVYFIFLVIVVAPVFETLLMQLLPFKLLMQVGIRDRWVLYFAMVGAFAAAHLINGLAQDVGVGLIGGAVMAFAFLRWADVSLTRAFAATSCCHAAYNGVIGGTVVMLSRIA